MKRCQEGGCEGRGPNGPTGKPRPVYAFGLCYEHSQEELKGLRTDFDVAAAIENPRASVHATEGHDG